MKSRLVLAGVVMAVLIVIALNLKSGEMKSPEGTDVSVQQQSQPPDPATESASSGTKYAVVTDSSMVSYSVGERLLRFQRDGTAVGKTSAMAGEIVLEDGVIRDSVIQVDLSTLQTDETRRDKRVRETLDTGNHPFATYHITGAEGDPVLEEGKDVTLRLQGNMTIKGTEKPLVFNATAKLEGDTLTLTAATTFKMTEFGITPPSAAGMISVNDDVKIDVTFVGKAR